MEKNSIIEELKEKNKSSKTNYGCYSIVESEQAKYERNKLVVPEFFDYEEFHDITNEYVLSSIDLPLLTFNEDISKIREDEMYEHLKKTYPDIIRNYKSKEYPWECTFYIPSIDLYIENRCSWEHGGHPYSTKRYDEILFDNIYESEQYEDALYVWSELDKEQREYATGHKLNWIEYYRSLPCIVDQLIHIEITKLSYESTDDEMKKEWKSICISDGSLSNHSVCNKITYHFQPMLSKHSSDVYFSDYKNKWKIFENRHFYCPIRWENITNNIVIRGLRICGLASSYSMFNPKLIRWFIHNERMENKVCYDPTGGWGHRMLGASNLVKKYIYNDLSTSTVEGIKNMISYLDINNVEVHNEDATTFIPSDDFDFMFTCPPYYAENHDTEKYECDGFHSQDQFDNFLDNLYNIYWNKESCKVFGLVLREDMLTKLMKENVSEKYPLKLNASHFQRSGCTKRFIEYLYIFRKK